MRSGTASEAEIVQGVVLFGLRVYMKPTLMPFEPEIFA